MLSVGIDIVERQRARSLYQTCRSKLGRYLSPGERSHLSTAKDSVQAFAEILAVKEAAFKALEIPWFGLSGWKRICLEMTPAGPFKVRFSGSLARQVPRRCRLWVHVASTKEFILARVLLLSIA